MKPIRIENGIVIYYGNRVGRVAEGKATVDPMFQAEELSSFLDRHPGIQEVLWMDGMFDRLAKGPKDLGEAQALKNVRVWQLKPDVDIYMKFVGYEEMCRKFGPPTKENYQQVYDGAVETNELEALYTKFNVDIPQEYEGHSLSMSDVLELYDEQGSSFYYVDRIGFKQVEFDAPAQTLTQSQSM